MSFIERNRISRPRNQINNGPDPKPRKTQSRIQSDSSSSSSPLIKMLNKEKKFMKFGGLGCASSSEASAPEVIRAAADWKEAKRMSLQKHRKKKKIQTVRGKTTPSPIVVDVISDVCCAPGIGFASSDAVLMDCVVESTRPITQIRRHRENPATRFASFQHPNVLISPSAFDTNASNSEIIISQSNQSFGGNLDRYDRFGAWRLDIDHMSYEEMLDLSDKIGYVGTGLSKDMILRCLKKTKLPILDSVPLLVPVDTDYKCSICQDEYKTKEETGKLYCGHSYHVHCIKQWLLLKNTCPICKAAVSPSY